jgi:flagellar hook-associated protein 3 FlgL
LHSLPVSAALNISTGVDGISRFMRVQTQEGPKSVFNIVQEFETSLEKSAIHATRTKVDSAAGALLTFDTGPNPTPLGLRIEGPLGQADVSADIVYGTIDSMIAAVNAKTELTGVRASAAEDGNALVLLATDGNAFTISHVETDGVTGAEDTPSNAIKLQHIRSDGLFSDPITLVDKDSDLSASLSSLDTAINHFSIVQAQVGAYAATAQMQSELLARKEITVDEAISGITDADLTEVVTQLQSLLVNRDALRQVFAKVGQQSLFDLIR